MSESGSFEKQSELPSERLLEQPVTSDYHITRSFTPEGVQSELARVANLLIAAPDDKITAEEGNTLFNGYLGALPKPTDAGWAFRFGGTVESQLQLAEHNPPITTAAQAYLTAAALYGSNVLTFARTGKDFDRIDRQALSNFLFETYHEGEEQGITVPYPFSGNIAGLLPNKELRSDFVLRAVGDPESPVKSRTVVEYTLEKRQFNLYTDEALHELIMRQAQTIGLAVENLQTEDNLHTLATQIDAFAFEGALEALRRDNPELWERKSVLYEKLLTEAKKPNDDNEYGPGWRQRRAKLERFGLLGGGSAADAEYLRHTR
jgi:hypothetical protein